MSNFYRWFADESAKLAQYLRSKKRAESREKEAFERFQAEGRGYPRSDGRKTVRLAFSLRILKKNLAHKIEEASAQVERRFMSSIVDTQRELLVQAWHVHVARAIKRVGNDPESYTVRKTWRELAGAYAILCLVDSFGIIRENTDIGFNLGADDLCLIEGRLARRGLTNDPAAGYPPIIADRVVFISKRRREA